MSIGIRQVSKAFGHFQAVRGVNLDIATGELVALLGPSGSGKTTLLRMIAGLEGTDQGRILLHSQDYTHKRIAERKVGFVFQHYALFRHMTIAENIAFGLKVRPRRIRPSKADIRKRVRELLRLVQLEGLDERYPSQLSGGQRQRVALARALAIEPVVLLLDEPFGALDAQVRQELRRWLRELHDKLNITTVFVTHDQEEALEMADRIVVMNEGKVEQVGTPDQVYHFPANPFVYGFIGRVNRFARQSPHAGTEEIGYIRPHDIGLDRHNPTASSVPATVYQLHQVGPTVRLELLRTDTGEPFEAEVSRERFRQLALEEGDRVFADLGKMTVFGSRDPSNDEEQSAMVPANLPTPV